MYVVVPLKDIVPSGFLYCTIRRRVQNSVAESMNQLNHSTAESVAALLVMHDQVVVSESDLADSTRDDSEYLSSDSESVTDIDGSR